MKLYTVAEEAEKGILIRDTGIMECNPTLTVGDPGSQTCVPLGGELRQVFQVARDSGLKELRLWRAELSTHGALQFIKERNPRDSRALVYVSTECGDGGMLRYFANSYEEAMVRNRVVRQYDTFPPPGVEAVAVGTSNTKAPHGLFIMSPGSSFRIERSGDLEGASPVLIVAWPGSSLRCFPPKKYQESAEAA